MIFYHKFISLSTIIDLQIVARYAKLIPMKTEEIILNNFTMAYPVEKFASPENVLFFDIETTGFLSSSSSIYLIGCAYYSESNWCIKQFFANGEGEEEQLLNAFFEFAGDFSFLIHYNGNTFDLPFIESKAKKYGIDNPLSQKDGLDIYQRVKVYKNLLKLPDCKLKTVQMFLGTDREDEFSGGELISVYSDYLSSHDYNLYHTLLLHNSDDIKGMLETLPILGYFDLFNDELTATKVSSNYYHDSNGIPRKELLINISFESLLPVPISFMGCGCYFKGHMYQGTLIIPIYEEELKYFYANYKDYYYLPLEDTALHKSIASFVDKDYRTKATAANCYTRKMSVYLPQWAHLVEPFFKREYSSKDLFFELTDEIKQNRELFGAYASHVLNKIAFQE